MSSSRHPFARSFLVTAAAFGLVVALSLPAWAQAPSISLSPSAGHPCQRVTVAGSEFGATEIVQIEFDSTQAATASTDSSGAFQTTFRVPGSALPGSHEVIATGETSGLSAQAAFVAGTDWSEFRYDDRRAGTNPYENVLSPSNVAGLQLEWSQAIGYTQSSPAVAGGVVYIESETGFHAFDAFTGSHDWSDPAVTGSSPPTVAHRVIFVGSDAGTVYALRASTGKVKWSHATGGPVSSAPVLANGVVYVGSWDHNVDALNASTGTLLWSYATGDGVSSSPAIANGVVYIGSDDGKIYALDASTGALRWSFESGAPYVDSSPAVVRGVVFIGQPLVALDAATGNVMWSVYEGSVSCSAAVANGTVYIGSTSGHLTALGASTGTTKWSFATGSNVRSSPAVANGVVYVGSDDQNVYALNAATGQFLWSYTTGSGVLSSPAVANGWVYVPSQDGNLYAFGL